MISPIDASQESDTIYSFLDFTGRTRITMKLKNVLDIMKRQEIVIEYQFSRMQYLRKPITVATASALIFACIIGFSRIETNIGY